MAPTTSRGQAARDGHRRGGGARAATRTAAGPARGDAATDAFQHPAIQRGAIGVILSQVAAGLQGREGPVEQDEARALQEQALRLRESAAMFQAIKTGREILKATPTADHEKVISQLEATVQLPGLGDMLRATAKPGVDADGVIKFLDENPTLIPGMADLIRNGVIDPDSAIAVVTDLMKRRAASLVSKDLCHNR